MGVPPAGASRENADCTAAAEYGLPLFTRPNGMARSEETSFARPALVNVVIPAITEPSMAAKAASQSDMVAATASFAASHLDDTERGVPVAGAGTAPAMLPDRSTVMPSTTSVS
jgi:hypothetical protein